MSESALQEFLSRGGQINKVPQGCSALDPITGMTKEKLKNYLKSRKNGANASPKPGRPRKHCQSLQNNAILSQY